MILTRINEHIGGRSNEEIAVKASCTMQTVRNARDGKSVSKSTATRLAKALKVKLDDLQ